MYGGGDTLSSIGYTIYNVQCTMYNIDADCIISQKGQTIVICAQNDVIMLWRVIRSFRYIKHQKVFIISDFIVRHGFGMILLTSAFNYPPSKGCFNSYLTQNNGILDYNAVHYCTVWCITFRLITVQCSVPYIHHHLVSVLNSQSSQEHGLIARSHNAK